MVRQQVKIATKYFVNPYQLALMNIRIIIYHYWLYCCENIQYHSCFPLWAHNGFVWPKSKLWISLLLIIIISSTRFRESKELSFTVDTTPSEWNAWFIAELLTSTYLAGEMCWTGPWCYLYLLQLLPLSTAPPLPAVGWMDSYATIVFSDCHWLTYV